MTSIQYNVSHNTLHMYSAMTDKFLPNGRHVQNSTIMCLCEVLIPSSMAKHHHSDTDDLISALCNLRETGKLEQLIGNNTWSTNRSSRLYAASQ